MRRILIVDDDFEFLETVALLLEEAGYEVGLARDSVTLFAKLDSWHPNLIVLDVGLGSDNGFDLLTRVRETSDIPIILLTGRAEETDKVKGLGIGADDYITKPYRSAEFLARVASALRRSLLPSESQVRKATFGNFVLDMGLRKLTTDNGEEIPLTSGEYALLAIFVRNPDDILSREQLLGLTDRINSEDRSVDIQVMRLRRKLTQDASSPNYIHAVRSVGYTFCAAVTWG